MISWEFHGMISWVVLCCLIWTPRALDKFTSVEVNSDSFEARDLPAPCSAVPATQSVTIKTIYLAQTHLMTPLENPFFFLAQDRSALLKVDLTSNTEIPAPEVSATALFKDGTTKKLCLVGPANIPVSLNSDRQNRSNSFVVTLPRSWISNKLDTLTIAVLGSASKSYSSADLSLDGRTPRWNLILMEFFLFGDAFSGKPPLVRTSNFFIEYLAMLPFSSIKFLEFPVAINLPYMAIAPRSDSVGKIALLADGYVCHSKQSGSCMADNQGTGTKVNPCYTGMWSYRGRNFTGCTKSYSSNNWCPWASTLENTTVFPDESTQWGYCSPECKQEIPCPWAGFGLISAVLSIQNAIRSANGMGSYAHGYGAIAGSIGGGLGGGSGGAGDNYGGIFFHEMGHAFGLGHSQDEYAAGSYPYPGNINTIPGGGVGTTWGFEQDTGYFVPVISEGSNLGKEKQDPMQGGAGTQRKARTWAMFSDYNAKRVFDNVAGSQYGNMGGVVQYLPSTMGPNRDSHYKLFNNGGRAYWDENQTPNADGSKFVKWNGTHYVVQPLGNDYPLEQDIPVYTVYGSYSFVTKEASLFYPLLNYLGNYKRLLDPRNSEDWNFVTSTGYCYWGCDFYLEAKYRDETNAYHIMQNDLYRKADHTDPTSGNSFFYFGVNFKDNGVPLVEANLYFRPLKLSEVTNMNVTTYLEASELVMSIKFGSWGGRMVCALSFWSVFIFVMLQFN